MQIWLQRSHQRKLVLPQNLDKLKGLERPSPLDWPDAHGSCTGLKPIIRKILWQNFMVQAGDYYSPLPSSTRKPRTSRTTSSQPQNFPSKNFDIARIRDVPSSIGDLLINFTLSIFPTPMPIPSRRRRHICKLLPDVYGVVTRPRKREDKWIF